MKGRAIVGLGQSGTFMVDDLIPYLKNTASYCVNSCRINYMAAVNIKNEDVFCFGKDAGFHKQSEVALEFLNENENIKTKLYEWFDKIYNNYEEIILITFFTSGTGIGTMISLLSHLCSKDKMKKNSKKLRVVVCRSSGGGVQFLNIIKNEILEIKKYESMCKNQLFLDDKGQGYDIYIGRSLDLYKLHSLLGPMRSALLDILLNEKYEVEEV